MRHLDPQIAHVLASRIARVATRPWVLMDVCGPQTHTLIRDGFEDLLLSGVELLHGPGCPLCVTPLEVIDRAIGIAGLPGVILASYGDMLRVPGSHSDLCEARARGADVRVVHSPMDALDIARENPERIVVFFGIGLETAAPSIAMALWQARSERIVNFSTLASHLLVPAALRRILQLPGNRVQGFVAPGHACTTMGCGEYRRLARDFHIPIVMGGFEAADLLDSIFMLVTQLEEGRAEVENQCYRSVEYEGNPTVQDTTSE